MIFPRKRSLLYKLCVIVPLCWLLFLLVTEFHREVRPDVLLPPERLIHPPIVAHPVAGNGAGHQSKDNDNENLVEGEHGMGVLPIPEGKPGEMGKAFKLKNLTREQEKLQSEGWKKNAFNQFISDLISVKRALPDPRDEW